ncbi:Peroxidase superfamily protein [Perilla frutescens var. hirtella]|uniref:Peroxidase n=1 Tax=Perilla frutescens var. hirtella TaxID=608512 RepID=A0AAD4NY39_PERFH|nr:Peroxidase superfamily protein [Perilla frutescens var. hirtella]
MTMASSALLIPLLLLLLLLFPQLSPAQTNLNLEYYAHTCPNFGKIIQEVVTDKQLAVPTTAAGSIRLFFHDCVVGGCDASILISSSQFSSSERDNDINHSLPGDAFDVVIRAKTRLELECPGIVSCSDILAEATRDLVTMVGGPFYPVALGRRDSAESRASDVEGHIARANMSITQIIDIFMSKGFTVQEMVALTGAHTVGFSHCSEFSYRIFNFSKTSDHDPSMNPEYVAGLRKLCENFKQDPTIAAFNDPMSPGKFDNTYYLNLQRGLGLLSSDQAMATDERTKPYVDMYAADQSKFFEAFAKAMEKVSTLDVKTGDQGEVRKRCDTPNAITMH